MEQIMISRLSEIIEKIRALTEVIKIDTLIVEDATKIEIACKKLECLHTRFSNELNNYFRLSTEPSPDDISRFSSIQLESEEALIEMTLKLKNLHKDVPLKEKTEISSKLPKLHLPSYSGDILEWQQFYDHFCSNIDNRNLPDVDKLLYLKSSLTGDAKKTIEGLETTNKNYQIAMTTLKERFGKPNQIIDAHYGALYKIKPAEMTATDCRRTLNEIERHIRVLHSLGENTNHSHLRFIITEKFPHEIIYEMKMALKTDNVDDIRKQLEVIVSAKEDANRITQEMQKETTHYSVETLLSQNSQKSKSQNTKINRTFDKNKTNIKQINNMKQFKPLRNTKSHNLNSGNKNKRKFPFENKHQQNSEKKPRYACIFCQGAHYNEKCDVVKTISERKLKLKNRCFNCLQEGHRVNTCTNNMKCCHCGSKHNRALCSKYGSKFNRVENTRVMHTYCPRSVESGTVLQTAVVKATPVNDTSKQVKCKLLLDSGSQRSYITQKLEKELNLPIEEEQHLSVFTFGSDKPQEYYSPVVKLRILSCTGTEKVVKANVVYTIAQDLHYTRYEIHEWTRDKILADDGSMEGPIDILIGNDYYYSLIIMEKIKIKDDLYLINSELGWILSGKLDDEVQTTEELMVVTYFQSSEVKLQEPDLPLNNITLKSLWDLESIGITDSPNTTKEEEALNNFNNTTKFKEGRYSVSWPWKEYPPDLPTNKGLVQGRLIGLLKKMDKDTLKSYDQTIRDQLDKGIIEKVPSDKIHQCEHPIHYLAFHGVTAPGKLTRLVYDASAKLKDCKCLNECLLAGPILLEDLTRLLIRFRLHRVALTADVEKAFLQIALEEDSRDVTRFLWIKDIDQPATEDNILYLRFCRVPFGIISSPFILNATIKHHLMKSTNNAIRRISNDFYVDNLLTGTMTTLQGITLYNNLKKEFQAMSMNLREWSSNSKELMQMIPDACKEEVVKVLGLDWNTQNDTLQLRNKKTNYKDTKRGILKSIASVYDPCGYAVPFLLRSKIFLQELWKNKVKWDSPLPNQMVEDWKEIQETITTLQVTVPRYYIKDVEKMENQLHCFADASTKAYAAVVYITNGNGKSFIIGKSRLVPIKDQENLKIPRLELLGVLIGNRLLKYVESSLKLDIKHHFLWTDSQIVIDWYNSDKLLTPFVARRIEEIKRNKKLILRFVPTNLNSADVATWPITMECDKSIWLDGPDFLMQPESTWPVNLLKEHSFLTRVDLSQTVENADKTSKAIKDKVVREKEDQEVINIENQTEQQKINEIKAIQERYFPEEVNMKETNLSRNLKLFKDENGLLRCKGRLENTDWSYDLKYPVLLPKNCNFTNDLILKVHKDNYHVGPNHTLSIIRQNYWIPQGKSQVQKILKHCPRCVKHGGGPYRQPPTPALPAERVNYSSPFTFMGLDYLGPVLTNTESGTEKRWICIYTCLAVRAIHLEIIKNLSAEEGLLALRRMIATRGVPAVITSDNAAQFKLISEILNNSYCIKNEIKWKFIPQLAPWFGGFYERLVGLVKHCLKRTLGKHLLNDSQMLTVIKEIEAILNTRPLTCVDSELVHILRPADFLTMGKCLTTEMTCNDGVLEGTSTKSDLIKGWTRGLKILEEFKAMFTNRYLPSLRERYNSAHKEPRITSHLTPEIGQIVQIKGDNKNREDWKVGKISALVKGSDGFCRVAKVLVGDKEFTRSISQLYPLEIEENETKTRKSTGKEIGHIQSDDSRDHDSQSFDAIQGCDNNAIEVLDEDMENLNHIQDDDLTLQLNEDIEMDETVNIENSERLLHEVNVPENLLNEQVNVPGDIGEQSRPKRAAATKALEKIREWTSALVNIF